MSTISIEDFHKQAMRWQEAEPERKRREEIEHTGAIEEFWKGANRHILTQLSIDGLHFYETFRGQFRDYPSYGSFFQIDVLLPGVERVMHEDHDMTGIIRVTLEWTQSEGYQIATYYVWVNGAMREFDNPYAAFLAAFEARWNSHETINYVQ